MQNLPQNSWVSPLKYCRFVSAHWSERHNENKWSCWSTGKFISHLHSSNEMELQLHALHPTTQLFASCCKWSEHSGCWFSRAKSMSLELSSCGLAAPIIISHLGFLMSATKCLRAEVKVWLILTPHYLMIHSEIQCENKTVVMLLL